ncbi:MAG: inositol monophosphatase [Alphaproteobacteria bacterium]|nr:inositol monophosphatase [Alphaproteobacteria bacterium]
MTDNALHTRFLAACAIAREAGDMARHLFESRQPGTFTLKGRQDFLTEADGAVERLVTGRITEAFPDDTCVGEEGGGRYSAATWVIDPIDGTANFARGIPHFCVSIAFVHDGRPLIGAICAPMYDELFAARRGGGATVNGRPMHVSATSDIRQATIEVGWSARLPTQDYLALLGRVMTAGAGFRRGGSGALGLAYVAAGRSDGYAELHMHPWDTLAGLVMVEEAGGWALDFLADDGLMHGNRVLVCTPGIKDSLAPATGLMPK